MRSKYSTRRFGGPDRKDTVVAAREADELDPFAQSFQGDEVLL